MSTDPKFYSTTGRTVYDISMKDLLALPVFKEITKAISAAPKGCEACCWQMSCGGGNITNRFGKDRKFDNPSIYCEGLKLFYSNIFSHLLSNGITANDIAKNLQLQV